MFEAALVIEVPSELLVKLLDRRLQLDRSLPHDGVHLLRLLKSLLGSVNSIRLQ